MWAGGEGGGRVKKEELMLYCSLCCHWMYLFSTACPQCPVPGSVLQQPLLLLHFSVLQISVLFMGVSVVVFISLLVNDFCYHFTCSFFPGKNAHKIQVLFREPGDAPTITSIFWVCNPCSEDYLQNILRCCQTIENIIHRN
jgi:hypothetical protein